MNAEGPAPAGAGSASRLDNLTLSRKEGFRRLAEAPRRVRPEILTPRQLGALSTRARTDYDKRCRIWHANIGPIRTPQLKALQQNLWDIVDSNAQDGDKAKGAIAVDAFPGLGKTTAVLNCPAAGRAVRWPSTHGSPGAGPRTRRGRRRPAG
ncbi:hypothetical protein AB0L54_36160, partial [Streptomyces sp. NPDC052196]|uniref:hypothetical protein n=1 Tax=Streptomyces sp. NPDC052196 TaxID=3156691 RepID=UPI00343E5C57